MKRILAFAIGSFLIVNMTPHSFASGSIEKQGHDRHHHDEAQGLALSGKIDENGIRVIEVRASKYKFEPDPIVIKLGEKVRLLITSTDVAHGLAITELKVNISVPAGETKAIEFVADKKGTFHMHCSVYCGPGHGHMHGALVIQ